MPDISILTSIVTDPDFFSFIDSNVAVKLEDLVPTSRLVLISSRDCLLEVLTVHIALKRHRAIYPYTKYSPYLALKFFQPSGPSRIALASSLSLS